MRLYIIRHARTEANQKKIVQGQLHGTISTHGKQQLTHLARRMAAHPLDVIYTSDLRRAQETAQAIANVNVIREDSRLRERAFGRFEGKPYETIQWDDETVEPLEKLRARLREALDEIHEQHQGENVAVVTHGGSVKCLLAEILGLTDQEMWDELPRHVNNTSVTIIEYREEPEIKLLFCDEHLPADLR